jgi:hypothetical protein
MKNETKWSIGRGYSEIALQVRHFLIVLLKAYSKFLRLVSIPLIKNLQLMYLICG